MFGPIFAYDLLTGARRARYFVVRGGYALILLVALLCVYSGFPHDAHVNINVVARYTASFFMTFAVLQLLAVVVLAPAMTAGTIATERERRTIEYLFAADLGNAEIVLSKWAARLIEIAILVSAGLPILALAMLLGGIAPEALLAVYLLTLSTLLAVSSVSMLVSVWAPKGREAVTRAFLILAVLLIVPPLLLAFRFGNMAFYDAFVAPWNGIFLASNPFYVLFPMLQAASGTGTTTAWQMLGWLMLSHGLVTVVCMTGATALVRRAYLRRAGAGATRRRFAFEGRRPIGNRPMLWKELYTEPPAVQLGLAGRMVMWLMVIGVVVSTFYMGMMSVGSRDTEEFFIFCLVVGVVVGCVALLLVAARAAGAITSEEERDCWVSLVSTPLTSEEIVYAKIAGNLYAVRGLLILLAVLWVVGGWIDATYLAVIPFWIGTLGIIGFFVSALGILMSLWCKTSMRAMGATLAICLFLGGGYFFCCIPMAVSGGSGEEVMFAPCIPFLLAFPGIVHVSEGQALHGGEIAAAYILGIIGYLVAGIVLSASAVYMCDTKTGRFSRQRFFPPESRSPLETKEAGEEEGT